MASELPIVTRLRSSICENKCKAMLASSGCDCAEAADLITELTEALRNVQIEAELEHRIKTIEQEYSDFRQLVSDAVVEYRLPELFAINADGTTRERGFKTLKSFIIPAPTPDPLVEVLGDLEWNNNSPECAAELRAALEARGLEIKEKE